MDSNSPLLTGLNDAQKLAVSTFDGPVLVVAGPGSGKTRVLTHRIAALVQAGVPEDEILAVTFTNKAALEMRERLAAMLGPMSTRKLWVGTFHGIGLRLLRRHSNAAGLLEQFSVVDADDARRLVKDCMTRLGIQTTSGDIREMHSLISKAKNDGLSPDTASVLPQYRSITDVFAAYQSKLRELSAVDFDDLLGLTLHMLEHQPGILARYQEKFKYVLVDEFQDTNQVQYSLVQLLGAKSRNVCVVGDPAQSIYSWRGSRPAVVDEFVEDFSPVTTVILGENYRSTPQIVNVCDKLLEHSQSTLKRTLTTSNPDGEPVRFWVHGDDRDENDMVVKDIRKLPDGVSAAVIARTNAQTRGFEDALIQQGISYVVVGSLRFYERMEIRDALAYLRVAANDRDALSLARIANTPRRGLGPAAWEPLAESISQTGSIVESLRILKEDPSMRRYAAGLASLHVDIETLRDKCEVSLTEVLKSVYEQAGLLAFYKAQKDGGEERVENLGELLTAAGQFTAEDSSAVTVEGALVCSLPSFEQVRAFLESTALASGSDTDAAGAKVVLTTAHAAKGREFDHVYVVGVEDGLFPHVSSDDFEEERRLLFVACSRARFGLTISRCQSRMTFGQRLSPRISPFLAPFKSFEAPAKYQSSQKKRAQERIAPPAYRLDLKGLSKGLLVQHHVFGVGEVLDFDATTVTVRFGSTPRQLRLDMAPLKAVPQSLHKPD